MQLHTKHVAIIVRDLDSHRSSFMCKSPGYCLRWWGCYRCKEQTAITVSFQLHKEFKTQTDKQDLSYVI